MRKQMTWALFGPIQALTPNNCEDTPSSEDFEYLDFSNDNSGLFI